MIAALARGTELSEDNGCAAKAPETKVVQKPAHNSTPSGTILLELANILIDLVDARTRQDNKPAQCFIGSISRIA